jgi:DNA repair protein RadC
MDKLTITQWAVEDRPREKMMMHGVGALSDAELLAILIGSGNTEDSAVELMRKVLAGYGNSLAALGKTDVETLCTYKGIGPAKAITILAATELGRRRKEEDVKQRMVIRDSMALYEYFHPILSDLPTEEFWIVLLNQGAKVIDRVRISTGGISGTVVDVRCVLREALLRRAVCIAACHNHPSGQARPSIDDDRLTERLYRAAQTMDIRLIDHVILTDGNYYSYADEGKLK